MNGNVFVDTNILVYSRDSSEPVKQPIALEKISELWENRKGRISIQVCSEYFVTLTQKLKPGLNAAEAWQDVADLFAWEPIPLHIPLIKKARGCQLQYKTSWWDSLIISAAFFSNCSTILSEDLNAGQEFFGITVENPFL
jgi:predicted nucleic acid-binding protein